MKKNTLVYLYVTQDNNKTKEFLAVGLIVREPINRYNKIYKVKILEINPIDTNNEENLSIALSLLDRVFPRHIDNIKVKISNHLWNTKVKNQTWLSIQDKHLLPHSKP